MPEARLDVMDQVAPKESVGSWPLAITILDTIGGTPAHRYPAFISRDRERVTSSRGGHAEPGSSNFH